MTTAATTVAGLSAIDRVKALAPSRPDLIDAAFVAGIGSLAMLAFWKTFDSPLYLVAGVIGIVLGILIAHLANVLRQPAIVLAGLTVVAYFLLGGAIALREDSLGGILPTPAAVTGLSQLAVGGWKDLVTTLPPVDTTGPLVAIPYLLGLLSGTITFTVARRVRPAWVPLLPLGLLTASVILLGTRSAGAPIPVGLGFAGLGVCWLVVRTRRRVVQLASANRNGRSARVGTGAALMALAAGVAVTGAGAMPGAGAKERFVLRTIIEPPFDPAVYASPVAGFRRFTEGAKTLWDQPLLTVTGLPEGSRLRFATLDDYNGTVWSAQRPTSGATGTGGYQRVGSLIDQSGKGDSVTYAVTVEPAYAALSGLNPWLPASGAVSRVDFVGDTKSGHLDGFRYDLAASQGIVPDRLRAGDKIDITGTRVAVGGETLQLSSGSLTAAGEFLAPQATKWSAGQTDRSAQLLAVAKHLQTTGAYSDGTAAGEARYLPGHSMGRLTAFVNAKQLVGNDEQYASTFALIANQLGIPARVVMGAVVPADGKIKGEHVHVWVEVLAASGSWLAIPETRFMPDRTKKPDQVEDDPIQDRQAAIVPPPQVSRPPGSSDVLFDTDAGAMRSGKTDESGFVWPAWVMAVARVAGIPLAAVLAFAVLVLGAKMLRRRKRQRHGSATTRLAGGWREIVDRAIDFGAPVMPAATRHEQGRALAAFGVASLADQADRGVFGPGEPDDTVVQAYWAEVKAARKKMGKGRPLWRRVMGALSLRSFAANAPKLAELGPTVTVKVTQNEAGRTARTRVASA